VIEKEVNSLNDRIKRLRKELDLSQEMFGSKIGIAKTTISNLEKGTFGISDRVVRDICREFNVNEEWLRTGEGEIFVSKDEDAELAEYVEKLLMDAEESPGLKMIKEILLTYGRMDEKDQKAIDNLIKRFLNHSNTETSAELAPEPSLYRPTAAEADYEKSLGIVRKTSSTASNTTGGDDVISNKSVG
jgi:DNA-binding XRE family transcriptional regulator